MDDISVFTHPFICQELHSNSVLFETVQKRHFNANMLHGFHLFKKTPRWRDTKVRFHFWVCSAFLPPPCCLSVLGCLSPFLVSTSRSAPSWQLAMLSLCVSLGADNCCSDLRWTALESGGSCLLLYWGMCLLCCRDEGPGILDILPFLPPPPPISFRHSDCLLRLGFFFLFFLLWMAAYGGDPLYLPTLPIFTPPSLFLIQLYNLL